MNSKERKKYVYSKIKLIVLSNSHHYFQIIGEIINYNVHLLQNIANYYRLINAIYSVHQVHHLCSMNQQAVHFHSFWDDLT